MWRRGANLEGAVANFVESEQIVEFDSFRSSFLQVQ
jgi:phosphatidylinositol 4-phosphatase